MSGENVLNRFEQTGSTDNIFRMGGTVNQGTTGTLDLDGTWKINGTAVTATASQLNNLEGGDAATGITAFAGGGQGSATALAAEFNNVTTVASAYDSVKLPTCSSGARYVVKNSGANILSVFPFLADSINALAVNLSIDIPVGGEMTFRGISATVWETVEAINLSAPTTQSGNLVIKAADNAANHEIILTNASHGQASTVTIPDSGLAASYLVQSTSALTVAEADILDGATVTTNELNKLDISAETETITTGAISVTKKITNLDTTAGATLYTLAAPDASMLGHIKVIHFLTDNGDATLTLTNVQGGSAATTCTWANAGEDLVLVGGVSKWNVVSEGGVVLS